MERRNRGDFWGWGPRTRRVAAGLIGCCALLLRVAQVDEINQVPIRPVLLVDPNDCPSEVLQTLPRMGPALTDRLVVERKSRPFRSLGDLDHRVQGIGPSTLAAIRPFLRIGSQDEKRPDPDPSASAIGLASRRGPVVP